MGLFDAQKARVVSKVDLSRKGSVDEPIRDLILLLNNHPDLVTLSSCSGRLLMVRTGEDKKKGCHWLCVKHETVGAEEAWAQLEAESRVEDRTGPVSFKFEAFILHLQCRTLELARRLHTVR